MSSVYTSRPTTTLPGLKPDGSVLVFETTEDGQEIQFLYHPDWPDSDLNQRAGIYRTWIAAGHEPEML